MTTDPGKLLLEALDAMPDHAGKPTRELFMYRSEYEALDKACQDQYGQTLPQYVGDYWKPTIIEPMPTVRVFDDHGNPSTGKVDFLKITYGDGYKWPKPDLPPIFQVEGTIECHFEDQKLYDACQTQSWYARLWMRYARFVAHVRSRKGR